MTRPLGPSSRTYVPAERRLLSEWVAQYHANDRVLMHVFVGAITPVNAPGTYSVAEYNMLGNRRRWVDAIIVYKDHVEMVEAKMVSEVDAIAQLQLYLRLFPSTVELGDIRFLPVSGVIVAAVSDPQITSFIRDVGLKEIVYKPAWVDDYFSMKRPKDRKPRSIGNL